MLFRYCGVLAPNAKLRRAVTASAGPAGATLQALQDARQKMGLSEAETADGSTGPVADAEPRTGIRRAAARCWALLLARIYECLPLRCERCGQPMRIIAFVLDPPVIERMELLRNPAFGDGSVTLTNQRCRRRWRQHDRHHRRSWTSTRLPALTTGRR